MHAFVKQIGVTVHACMRVSPIFGILLYMYAHAHIHTHTYTISKYAVPWADVATAFERHSIKKNQESSSDQAKGRADGAKNGAKNLAEDAGMEGGVAMSQVTGHQHRDRDSVSDDRQASSKASMAKQTALSDVNLGDRQTQAGKTGSAKAVSTDSKKFASIRHTTPPRGASEHHVAAKTASPGRATAFNLWGDAQRSETSTQRKPLSYTQGPACCRPQVTHTHTYIHTCI
jgi:hypothetical protein